MEITELCVGCMGERGPTSVCPECGWDDRSEQLVPVALPYRTVLRGQYVFGRELGHGGFGITYLARDLNLNLKVAIKEYLPGDYATRGNDRKTVTPYSGHRESFDYGLSSFLDEARALARFSDHPNIVRVLNFFREHGTGYLVMSYVPGRTLKQYLDDQGGRIPVDTAIRVLMPVMDALREVHAAGLLHRDISPDNIYLTDSAQVKLIDFGAARYAMGVKSKNLSVVLKPGYAPWEQYQSRGDQGPWTDVYAVGATLYRAITGSTPPQAPDRIEKDELVPPSRLGIALPPAVERALGQSLAMKIEQRFRTVEAFQAPLLESLSDHQHQHHHQRQQQQQRHAPPPPTPIPGPTPTPLPALALLDQATAHAARAAARVAGYVSRFVPAVRLPSRFNPTMATLTAVVGCLVGLLGSTGAASELLGLSINAQVFGAFFPGLVPFNTLMLALALVGHLALVLGGVQWLRSDDRGPVVVWGAAWTLVALTLFGLITFIVLAPMSGAWAAIAATTQSSLIGGALGIGFTGLLQLGLVIVLMWKGEAPS